MISYLKKIAKRFSRVVMFINTLFISLLILLTWLIGLSVTPIIYIFVGEKAAKKMYNWIFQLNDTDYKGGYIE